MSGVEAMSTVRCASCPAVGCAASVDRGAAAPRVAAVARRALRRPRSADLDRVLAHLERRRAGGDTIVLASHEFELVDLLPRRVAVLDEGRLRAVLPATAPGARQMYRELLAPHTALTVEECRAWELTRPRPSVFLPLALPAGLLAGESSRLPSGRGGYWTRTSCQGAPRRGPRIRLLRRRRAARGAVALLAGVAWLPPLVLPLRAGSLGLATFEESLLLAVALCAVVLPLLALLAGADLLAGEIEDRTVVPVITLPISRAACFAGKVLRPRRSPVRVVLGRVRKRGHRHRGLSGQRGLAGLPRRRRLRSVAVPRLRRRRSRARRLHARACPCLRLGARRLAAMVFAVDAALLAAVVALAPPPPQQIGTHGHSELAAPGRGRRSAIREHQASAPSEPQPGVPRCG